MDVRLSLDHRQQDREPVRVDTARHAPRGPVDRRRHQRLDLDEERPAPLGRRDHEGPRRRLGPLRQKERARIGHLAEALAHHLEDAHLVSRPEAVLRRPHDAKRVAPIALESEHRVDQVLEHLGPRERALFRDVTDQEEGDAVALGDFDQARGHLAELRHAPGARLDVARAHRLDRIHDGDVGVNLAERRLDVREIRRREDLHVAHPRPADALAAHRHLGRRLLPRRVNHRVARGRQRRQRLHEERRLPDARISAEERHATRDGPAPEHAVELTDPRREPPRVLRLDVAERDRGRPRAPRAALSDDLRLLGDRVPLAALRAPPEPARCGRPARRTSVDRLLFALRLGHGVLVIDGTVGRLRD